MKTSKRSNKRRPRVGVPWRTAKQESKGDLRYNQDYLRAVREAGGEPVQISLLLPPHELENVARALDAFVLPGSPADVRPGKYGEQPHPETSRADVRREITDSALLRHALSAGKPVLAICYGIQSLNAHLGGSMIQDIPSELRRPLVHSSPDAKDATHPVSLQGGGLAELAGSPQVNVNSTHHQALGRLGRGLRVIARAPDGVIEAVEWTRGPGWALGVQWHPERMPNTFAKNIFRRLVSEAAKSAGASPAPNKKRAAAKPKATRKAGKALHKKRRSGSGGKSTRRK
jgi:putative glutamine amidotransferase